MDLDQRQINLNKISVPDKPARRSINNEAIRELAASIKKLGLLQPILVTKKGSGFEVEAGHRRFLAAKTLGWESIECIVYPNNKDSKMHLPRSHENLIREDLNPVEEAEACYQLVYEEDRGVDRVALLLCKSRTWIESRLDIVDFPDDVKEALVKKDIVTATARALSKITDVEKRQTLLAAAIDYGASASVVRQWIEDSTVTAALTSAETQDAISNHVSVQVGVTQIECFCCHVVQPITSLRHVWLDSECLSFMIDTIKVVKAEMEKKKE